VEKKKTKNVVLETAKKRELKNALLKKREVKKIENKLKVFE